MVATSGGAGVVALAAAVNSCAVQRRGNYVALVDVLCAGNYLNVATLVAAINDADKHMVGVGVALDVLYATNVYARHVGCDGHSFLNLKSAGKEAVFYCFEIYSVELYQLAEPTKR